MTQRLQVSVSDELFSWLSSRASLSDVSMSREASSLLQYAKASLEGETPFDFQPDALAAEEAQLEDPVSHRQVLLGPR